MKTPPKTPPRSTEEPTAQNITLFMGCFGSKSNKKVMQVERDNILVASTRRNFCFQISVSQLLGCDPKIGLQSYFAWVPSQWKIFLFHRMLNRYTCLERMLAIYLQDTIKFNHFKNVFTRHKKESGLTFLFLWKKLQCCQINLGCNFMIWKKKHCSKSSVPLKSSEHLCRR